MALCHVVHNDATYYKTIATPTHYINPLPATTVDAPRLDYIVAISACAAHDDGPPSDSGCRSSTALLLLGTAGPLI